MGAMEAIQKAIAAAINDTTTPPEVEFVGEYREAFAAAMQNNLRHVTVDNEGRRYRLIKIVFEELQEG